MISGPTPIHSQIIKPLASVTDFDAQVKAMIRSGKFVVGKNIGLHVKSGTNPKDTSDNTNHIAISAGGQFSVRPQKSGDMEWNTIYTNKSNSYLFLNIAVEAIGEMGSSSLCWAILQIGNDTSGLLDVDQAVMCTELTPYLSIVGKQSVSAWIPPNWKWNLWGSPQNYARITFFTLYWIPDPGKDIPF